MDAGCHHDVLSGGSRTRQDMGTAGRTIRTADEAVYSWHQHSVCLQLSDREHRRRAHRALIGPDCLDAY